MVQKQWALTALYRGATVVVEGGPAIVAETRGDVVLVDKPWPLPPGWSPSRVLVDGPVQVLGHKAA